MDITISTSLLPGFLVACADGTDAGLEAREKGTIGGEKWEVTSEDSAYAILDEDIVMEMLVAEGYTYRFE
jgi:hypothetical protein